MLEGLDQVDWKNIKHFDGTAEVVPDAIRSLVSQYPGEHDTLFGDNLPPGYYIQESTAFIVRFLIEIIDSKFELREALLDTIEHLLIDCHDGFASHRKDIERWGIEYVRNCINTCSDPLELDTGLNEVS